MADAKWMTSGSSKVFFLVFILSYYTEKWSKFQINLVQENVKVNTMYVGVILAEDKSKANV